MSAPPDLDAWPAPTPSAPIDALVDVPGSKSLTNRHLVLAALADAPTTIHAPLHSRDSALMIAALRTLGTGIVELPGGDLAVTPGPVTGGGHVDGGLAGTVMRFVPVVAALADAPVSFDGDPYARNRPMGPVLDALRSLGVGVDDAATPGFLPFTVLPSGAVRGGQLTVDASGSSQFVSALLLSAPRFTDGLDLRHVGATLPSVPHIDMTVALLRAAGVGVDVPEPGHWVVTPGPIRPGDVVVEPDLSNAGPFLAAALAAGGSVRIPRWPARTTQPGDLLPGLLERMGGTVRRDGDVLQVTGTGVVTGIDADLSPAGELTPTIAALAALATTPTTIRGVAHLRGHETDRLAALVAEITRLGGDAEETPDGLVIRPADLHGGRVRSYDDHRMATFGAVLGLAVPGIEVDDVATTAKTLPDFPSMWGRMVGSAGHAR